MVAATTAPACLRLKLDLPQTVVEEYERQAEQYGVSIEEIIASRLTECVGYTSVKPLYFTDADRSEAEKLLRVNLSRPQDLLRAVSRSSSIRVDSIVIALPPALKTRLSTRTFQKPWGKFITDLVTELLEHYVGLR